MPSDSRSGVPIALLRHFEVQSGKGLCPPHPEGMRIVIVPDGQRGRIDLYTEVPPTSERQ